MVEHVLVPVDRGDPADRAFAFAIEAFPDATITVLYVVSPAETNYLTGGERPFREAFEAAVEEATAFLEGYRDRARDAGVEVRTDHVVAYEGSRVARGILDYLDDHDVDHVVMGSHGRRGAARILLGSVAETVVRRAPVAVTVVR